MKKPSERYKELLEEKEFRFTEDNEIIAKVLDEMYASLLREVSSKTDPRNFNWH